MRVVRALAAVFVLCAAVRAEAAPRKIPVKIVNQSDVDLHGLFLSPVDAGEWGPDLLEGDVLGARGGTIRLGRLPCGRWDLRIVDADGDACVLEDVDLCKGEGEWKLTNKLLARCQAVR
ncbi:MAG: hypothetical protein JNK60_05185 [Acidobacteria bacterium]|nr:hypothetical protein [Acidobacteriota bacterium]